MSKIEKTTAEHLQQVAAHMFTDTRQVLRRAGSVMQSLYDGILPSVTGREAAHVKYLLTTYRKLVADNPTTAVAVGTVGQVSAVISRLVAAGVPFPATYGEARKLAYPPKNVTALAGMVADAPDDEADDEAATDTATKPETVVDPVALACRLIASFDADGLDTVRIAVELRAIELAGIDGAELREAA